MIDIILISLSWFFALILIASLILMFFFMWSNIKSKSPFIVAPNDTLEPISKAMGISDDSVVYDLGSGDGRVLFYLFNKNKKAKYFGVENNKFALFLSRINNFFHKKKHKSEISFIEKDFFDVDLSKATHIFTYLYPNIMDDLLPKLDSEVRPGTKLISMSFHFTTKREKEFIELNRGKNKIANQIYIYEF